MVSPRLPVSLWWGVTQLPFTARNFLTRPPTGRYFSPALPSDCFAIDFPGRASSPSEGLTIPTTYLQGGGQSCPLLRASNEHSFIVRVLRARRALGRSLLILLRPRVARAQKIIRLHPLLCSASRRTTRPPCPSFTSRGSVHRRARPGSLSPRDGSSKAAYSVCRHGWP